ncbi:MAG: O-antigen ligase family protein [Bacteroidota bacterium]|nr:O-antigen ligase family protein [Bacteroidota bacterium]
MLVNIQKGLRTNIIFVCLLAMLLSLFVSRFALSVTIILFIAITLLHRHNFLQIKQFIQSPFLLSLGLLFFIPFASGLWSSNTKEWLDIIRIKLPLLFLPLCFAGRWQLNERQWRWLGYFFLFLIWAGTCYSLAHYIQNPNALHVGYLKAKTIPTPLDNDHVRFSWLAAAGFLLCLFFLHLPHQKKYKIFFALIALWLAVYLHLLAARTGLFSLYIILFFFWLRFLFQKRKKIASLIVAFALICLPVLSWFAFPTFQNRIKYFIYDFRYVRDEVYLPGANDGNRFISIKAGWDILKNNPLGIGAGDIRQASLHWYDANIPGMLSTDKIYPSSEWLIYGLTAGWIGMILFTIIMLIPFFIKNIQHRFYWCLLNIIIAFGFLFDPGLKVQYGVFLYVFVVLWWWKWFKNSDYISKTN